MKYLRSLLLLGGAVVLLSWLSSSRMQIPKISEENGSITIGTAVAPPKAPAISAPEPPQKQPMVAITPAQDPAVFFERQIKEEPFASFNAWARDYLQASPTERIELEQQGISLARSRARALANLIQSDPEKALSYAIPPAAKRSLPEAVQPLVEEWVNAKGDYEVLCVYPLNIEEASPESITRSAVIDGESYRVYTYGEGLEYVTRTAVPFNGISLPAAHATNPPLDSEPAPTKLLAMDPNPVRVMDAIETAEFVATQATEPLCHITEQPWTALGEPVALRYGGDAYAFSSLVLASEWAATNIAAAELDVPENPLNLPVAASSYTEGRKRFILFRVDFPDYAGEVMSTNEALNLLRDTGEFMRQTSFGKLTFAPVGEGSDITPTMRLPNDAESYRNMGTLLGACRTAATDLGYDMNQYDFYFVCTAGRPSAGFAGLGYVGGVGFWLANRYFNVRTCAHEFGHNLGLGHANWWNTGGKSSVGQGSSDEYGDPFDTMGGSGGGSLHFSSYSKNKLGWIPGSHCPRVTQSGFFRLYAHDNLVESGLRGLRFSRSGGDYWLEFRQLFTGNKALMNGVGLRWVGGSTTLLDAAPGSADGKNDHAITIGRTFSDRKLGLHITPIGKGHTYPESMDVVVNLGAFPANRSPEVTVSASALSATANQPLFFSATASDADGDELAYSWDFGNGDYSVDNQPAASVGYGSAGEYLVQCTVTDMKGGTARDSVVVRVGNPNTFRIAGRVLTTNNLPVEGIKISTDGSHYAFTDSDGAFVVTRLGGGSHSLSIHETVYDELSFLNPFFNNPVSVGPSFEAADFILWPGELNVYTPLVAKGSAWKYLDNGSNQGTNWIGAGFNDGAWTNGAAILGFGQGNETTVLSYGPDSRNKYITYYFRKTFSVANPAVYTNLLLEILRDDGPVVYLNGQEIFRDNLPNGPITADTLALQPVEPDNYLSTNLPISVLQSGANQLAVEMHQVDVTSSDINFDLALSGLSVSTAASLQMVYVATPHDQEVFEYPASITINIAAHSGGTPVGLVRFFANGNLLAQDFSAPYTLTQGGFQPGEHQVHAVATLNNGIQLTSAPVTIRVVVPEPPPPVPVPVSLMPTGAVWKYLAGPTGAPAEWIQMAFDDSAWNSGPAELGYGENDERTRIPYGPDSNNKWVTTYFRRVFVVDDPYSITNANLHLKRDDGAIVYLNGQEVTRDLLPAGAVNHDTLADNAGDDGKDFHLFTFDPSLLAPGTNLLAVEVHQSSLSSSDLSFDLSVEAHVSTNRPRGVYLVSPIEGTHLPAAGQVTLAAEPVPGNGLATKRVEFFANAIKIGEATAFPFATTVSHLPPGPADLTAVATDSTDNAFASAPVRVWVEAPPVETSLISFGESWKYRDEGAEPPAYWMSPGFNDQGWKAGAARLGYGNDGETTVVSDGGDPNLRHIATYFRKRFYVPDPAQFNQALLRLVCDDGAAVYLNGTEVFRQNLQPGLISYNSLATRTVSGAEEQTPVTIALPSTLFSPGTNVIAVEVHQASISSSDIGFDLELTAQADAPVGEVVFLTSPMEGSRYYSPSSITLTAYAMAAGSLAIEVRYFVDDAPAGQSSAFPFAVLWSNPALGDHRLIAVATFDGGLTLTSAPVTVSIASTPPSIAPVYETLVFAGAQWQFWDNVAAVGTDWQSPAFNDSSWPTGVARFGWGFDGERTPLTERRLTHYFRRWFTVTNPALLTELAFQLARDDGAVVYLNGREVFRSNMPAGAISASTTASTTVNTPDETTYFETLVSAVTAGLVAGSNLVAVELHQGSANSSDAGFDLQLEGLGTTEPRIYFVSPTDGQLLTVGQPFTLEAFAWTGSGLAVAPIEFFANGIKIGQSLPDATAFVWSNAPLGTYELTARVNTLAGQTLVSQPLTVSVFYEPISFTALATGSLWKYFDGGYTPASNWMMRGYNDEPWADGFARLGYGNDGERTPVSYGGNANNKHITTYFRHWFTIPPAVTVTGLVCRLVRDDGAVVYLNGQALYRSNMPQGPVTFATRASSAVGNDEQTFFVSTFPISGLTCGTNLIAVEIHQSSPTSSDLGFDFELTGEGFHGVETRAAVLPPRTDGSAVYLSWPTDMIGWNLYYTTELLPGSTWLPVTANIIQSNGMNVLVIPPLSNGPRTFYRLEQR